MPLGNGFNHTAAFQLARRDALEHHAELLLGDRLGFEARILEHDAQGAARLEPIEGRALLELVRNKAEKVIRHDSVLLDRALAAIGIGKKLPVETGRKEHEADQAK